VSYKTIIVHLDAGQRRKERLDLAYAVAETYDAHLVGLFALEPLLVPAAPEAEPAILELELRNREDAAKRARAEFEDKLRKENYPKSEWRATLDDGFRALRFHARYADLVIMGQPEPEDAGGVPQWFAHELVLSAGKPILYIPYAGHFENVGKRIFIPWNASREASRAVWDGLPFLADAEDAEVVTFDPDKLGLGDDGMPDPDIAADLARHGARVTVGTQPSAGVDIGSLILSRAADMAADLVVMGAYGHSRVRELVLGGATRAMFKSMTVPTLMSH
jgi:nucleotide-binding universal stress UspA family protein